MRSVHEVKRAHGRLIHSSAKSNHDSAPQGQRIRVGPIDSPEDGT